MINGIIISPFGEQREKDDEKRNDINNKCYICSLEKIFLQRHKINFKKHNQIDHNIKNYLEFLDYLYSKDEKDLELNEAYIRESIFLNDISCFPIGKCLDDKGETIENSG